MAMMGSGYERRPEPEAPAGPRLRVYELAKDLNVQPKDLVAKVRAMGIEVDRSLVRNTIQFTSAAEYRRCCDDALSTSCNMRPTRS